MDSFKYNFESMIFQPTEIARSLGKTVRIIREYFDQRHFGVIGRTFFFQDKEHAYRVIPEAYHLSFLEFPYWATVRFEEDSVKKSISEMPRRDCLNQLLNLIRQKVLNRNPDTRLLPKSFMSFVRANEFGKDSLDQNEVHCHLLIKLHKEWQIAQEDLLSVMTSLSPQELSSCGIACFDFEFNQDPLGRVAYVCTLEDWEEEKTLDYSKGFRNWIRKHFQTEKNPIPSSLNPIGYEEQAAA
jgi:hypothetical protein